MERLNGHTSQETAYIVDDYPYGFRLRCKIRYWLEHRDGYGFRFCSQTTNPKRSIESWNAPKCGTYIRGIVFMVKNEEGHVSYECCDFYTKEGVRAFKEKYLDLLTELEVKKLDMFLNAK